MANEFTDGQALEALKLLKEHLPSAYRNGARDPVAREKVHNAATIAGIAFANAFLGVCHSLAHKLGAAFHLPHGLANALLIANVIRYNANDNPAKQAAFSQYDRPKAKCRLKRDLEIPRSIRDAGVAEADFLAKGDAIAEEAFDDQCTGANPRFPLIAELRTLLLDSYYGRPFLEPGGPEIGEPERVAGEAGLETAVGA
jgi:acetaldehyde dehydrogenase/alcohol dehydrogenase